MAAETPSVHASAVLAGARAVLIRGPAGAGKSQLALALIQAADTGLLRFARLIGDDRLHLEVHHGRLLVRPAAALAGLIEIRGVLLRMEPRDVLAHAEHANQVGSDAGSLVQERRDVLAVEVFFE